ncbi:MAG TPA: tetratricopeptide repeat protein [Verrucomicrobiae bacterium]|nr:tetratricopeptide repeat protein [Verrucomicrobiae bacterium]
MDQPRRICLCLASLVLFVAGCSRQPGGERDFADGLAYFKEGKFAKAASHFQNALATMQTNALALNFLGVSQLEAGETDAGSKNLNEAIQLDPNYIPARYNLALAQLERSENEEAIANLRYVVQSGSGPADAPYQLGVAYMQAAAWSQAEETFKRYLPAAPNSADTLNCLGVVAVQKRDFNQAKRWFEQSIAADPKFATAYLNLASLENHHLGQRKQALTHYETYLGLLPKSQPREDVRLAMLQINQELSGGVKLPVRVAQPPARTIKVPEPTPAPANSSPEASKPTESAAPKTTRTATENSVPTQSPPAPRIASVNPSPSPASVPVKKTRTPFPVRHLVPGNHTKALVYFNEGVRAQQQGDIAAAVSSYGKAVAIDPAFSKAYFNLAIAYRSAGQTERALENYELALMADPQYADARFNYAILLQEQGYRDDAIAQYTKILEENPNDASAHLSLAGIYARSRTTRPQAREHYQAFLKLSPNSPLARDIRRWLDENR